MKKIATLTLMLIVFTLVAYSQNKPKAEYKVGSAKVVVWENKSPNGEIWKNYQIKKDYKKDGKWESTNSFNEKELLQLKEAIEKAIKEEGIKTKEIPETKE